MRHTLSRTARLLAITAIFLTNLAACSHDETSSTLRLGYFPNITHAPALVGIEKGILADALDEVNLETHTFNAGPAAIEALFSGAIDAAYVGPNPAINGWAQSDGTALHIIAGSTSGGAALVVNGDITQINDLKGSTLASPQLANTQDVALRYWLADNGFDINGTDANVTITPTPNSEVVAAFDTGAIDGAWLPEPHLSRLIHEHDAHILVDERSLWDNGEFVTTQLIVRASFLDEHPDRVTSLLRGHVDAITYLNENPDDAAVAANAHLKKLSGKPLSEHVLQSSLNNLSFTVDPLASSLLASAEHARAVGLLDPVDLHGIYELSLLNEVLASRGIEAVDGYE